MGKQHFQVPFAEKEAAKAMGARWDPAAGLWYAPTPEIAQRLQARWPMGGLEDTLTLLPGEDRNFGGNFLFVDLIPRSCWFTNVRSCIDAGSWQRLSRLTRQRAGHRCEVCSGQAQPQRGVHLEAHERWEYLPQTGVQSLRRIVTLCTWCHLVTHWGYAQVSGREALARRHYKEVSGLDDHGVNHAVAEAFALWSERSQRSWTLDVSILSLAGLVLTPPSR